MILESVCIACQRSAHSKVVKIPDGLIVEDKASGDDSALG